MGGEIALTENRYPADASLTAEFRDGTVHGRHQCQPIAVSPDHCASAYGLGDRVSQNQVSVESRLWWKTGWQLHWHHTAAQQSVRLRLGTCSLPLFDGKPEHVEIAGTTGFARDGDNGIAVQLLLGFVGVQREDSNPRFRTHLLTRHSILLLAHTGWMTGEHELLALTWVGKPSDEARPWTVVSSEPGKLTLHHPVLEPWTIESPGLPRCVAPRSVPFSPLVPA